MSANFYVGEAATDRECRQTGFHCTLSELNFFIYLIWEELRDRDILGITPKRLNSKAAVRTIQAVEATRYVEVKSFLPRY